MLAPPSRSAQVCKKAKSARRCAHRFVNRTETALAELMARDDKALIQRCTLHERRNVADHLPDRACLDAKLVKAFATPTLTTGCITQKALRHN